MLSQSLVVVCNAPLVAPIPLPYNSPRFLQFDLPDMGEDLSHPPYISRHVHSAPKRKLDASDMDPHYPEPKRRLSANCTGAKARQQSAPQVNPHYPYHQSALGLFSNPVPAALHQCPSLVPGVP